MQKIKNLFVSTVIVAAGKGTRMNMDINKQYIEIQGQPVLARTLKVFQDSDRVDEIVLVVNEADIIFCKQNIIDLYGYGKVKTIVAGGKERQQSVLNGLREADKDCDIVLIHDGARPFVREESINAAIESAYEHGASVVAVPVKDTIKTVDNDLFVKDSLDRNTLWAMQTPQAFRYGRLMEAHVKACEEGFLGTDDAMLVERLGHRVKLVMGSYDNIKITTQEDLTIAETIVSSRPR